MLSGQSKLEKYAEVKGEDGAVRLHLPDHNDFTLFTQASPVSPKTSSPEVISA